MWIKTKDGVLLNTNHMLEIFVKEIEKRQFIIRYDCPAEDSYGKMEVYDTEEEAQAVMNLISIGIKTGQALVTIG